MPLPLVTLAGSWLSTGSGAPEYCSPGSIRRCVVKTTPTSQGLYAVVSALATSGLSRVFPDSTPVAPADSPPDEPAAEPGPGPPLPVSPGPFDPSAAFAAPVPR